MTRPPIVQNPLHGVESVIIGGGVRVEAVVARIHYMELKGSSSRRPWRGLGSSGIHYMELKVYFTLIIAIISVANPLHGVESDIACIECS
jgi:hypothetical protein